MAEMQVRAAAAQGTPVFLDRDATVEKVVRLTEEAAAKVPAAGVCTSIP